MEVWLFTDKFQLIFTSIVEYRNVITVLKFIFLSIIQKIIVIVQNLVNGTRVKSYELGNYYIDKFGSFFYFDFKE